MLPWKAHSEISPWEYAFFRFIDTCLGFVAALVVAHLLWPSRALNNLRVNIADRFHLLRQFFEHLSITQNLQKNQTLENLRILIEQSFNQSQLVLEESKAELLMQSDPLRIWIDLIKYQEQIWESLLTLQSVFQPIFEEMFDEELKRQVDHTMAVINFVLGEMALKLKNEKASLSFDYLQNVQISLNQELIRFRSTHRVQRYDLEVVEDYFVLFYQIRQILLKLQKSNDLLNFLKS